MKKAFVPFLISFFVAYLSHLHVLDQKKVILDKDISPATDW